MPPTRATSASPLAAKAAADHATHFSEIALFRLLTWSSPGYPTGAFSYSHGLEWAVESASVTNLDELIDYITAVISRGGGWADAVLFAHAWHATARPSRASAYPSEGTAQPLSAIRDSGGTTQTPGAAPQLHELAQLAAAFRGSAETALESCQQGAAFLDVTRKAWPHPTLEAFAQHCAASETAIAHCIAVAVACAAHDVPLSPALHAYIHAVAANLVSAGARLIPLGQTQAQIAIARLATTITEIAQRASTTSLDDLGTCAPAVELCSIRHETQYTRLFRS
jgi:urease accessory protein